MITNLPHSAGQRTHLSSFSPQPTGARPSSRPCGDGACNYRFARGTGKGWRAEVVFGPFEVGYVQGDESPIAERHSAPLRLEISKQMAKDLLTALVDVAVRRSHV